MSTEIRRLLDVVANAKRVLVEDADGRRTYGRSAPNITAWGHLMGVVGTLAQVEQMLTALKELPRFRRRPFTPDHEMERSHDGEWVRYRDVKAFLAKDDPPSGLPPVDAQSDELRDVLCPDPLKDPC